MIRQALKKAKYDRIENNAHPIYESIAKFFNILKKSRFPEEKYFPNQKKSCATLKNRS